MNLPEENLGSATGRARKDTTPGNGPKGVVDDLDMFIKNHPEIEFD
jgi:hypothetical protein